MSETNQKPRTEITLDDYRAIKRLVCRGSSLEDASEEVGVDVNAAERFIDDRLSGRKRGAVSFELKSVAEGALKTALNRLTLISEEGPRWSSEIQSPNNSDLDAAKSLARLAMDCLKLGYMYGFDSEKAKAAGSAMSDLMGPWELKQPGA